MKRALREARKGIGSVSPNPPVGAIIVKNHKILSVAHHASFGGPHAEVRALKKIRSLAKGATLYVTLEPCSTHGKTPPCTQAILKSGIQRIVIGTSDPNPIHRNRGIKILKRRGVHVEVGLLEEEAQDLIRGFRKWIAKKLPFCTVKAAMSLDGKIATSQGDSQWITGFEARRFGYRLRGESDAVMVGIRTIMKDNPSLSSHHFKIRDPLRVIVDSHAKISLDSKVVRLSPEKTILAVTPKASPTKVKQLRSRGVRIIQTPSDLGRVHLKFLFQKLAKIGISSILVEGGGTLSSSVFEKKLADEIFFFYAPLLMGGEKAPTSFDGRGFLKIRQALKIVHVSHQKIGRDLLIQGDVEYQ
ncbi:MAG: bifunctional diaminohydroxyphosphoribosylaminopyrimidine deaminase/5-amino-6-(5-phosphoribosylamino)uracil reductase RibD [Chlamydiae bacterium]|nr:bifunctional diaminohydroxyphosphoribosylaminopyrimidine deaminase/5-amino-6-(5-phosphoribosylamino)uracil reductase RibD [Chlamydiota bacterium]MBI3267154.1 bifunctional diaminohydroxyphosphoribosylaminopyrimidine deaminase/5-amino-6-(5-phosphoribosylamino)uracil reductase RibD [Chlamydiota bacterium]